MNELIDDIDLSLLLLKDQLSCLSILYSSNGHERHTPSDDLLSNTFHGFSYQVEAIAKKFENLSASIPLHH
jgi:hypothetical protein